MLSIPPHQVSPRLLLGLEDLAALGVRISRQPAWRWFHSGKMPKPVSISGSPNERLKWAASDIEEWLRTRRLKM
jgi:predicted DNA-binding transcriptional regulator AlpA